jgi:hypothetical protein
MELAGVRNCRLRGQGISVTLDAHSWEKEAIQEAAQIVDRDKMIAAISDEMLDAFAIAGTSDEARSRRKQYFEGWLGEGIVDLLIFYLPWYRVHPDPRVIRQILAHLGLSSDRVPAETMWRPSALRRGGGR